MWETLPSLPEKVWEQMRQWLGRDEGSRREKSQLCLGCRVRSGGEHGPWTKRREGGTERPAGRGRALARR